jgi:hypothetical protein
MTPLIYVLHSGNLYGTEQMALATLDGLRAEYSPLLFAPDGPVHGAAASMNIPATRFASPSGLFRTLLPHFSRHRRLAYVATGVGQSLIGHGLGRAFGRPMRHLHIVHGGTDERLSYGRKALLARLPVELATVARHTASASSKTSFPHGPAHAAQSSPVTAFAASPWSPAPTRSSASASCSPRWPAIPRWPG